MPVAIFTVALAAAVGGVALATGSDSGSGRKSSFASTQNCNPNYRDACVPKRQL